MHQFDTVYDVAVCGNGFCGYAAALSLAETGQQVLLVGRRPVLGWEATWAFQLDIEDPSTDLGQRLVAKLSDANAFARGRADAPAMEMVLDRMASEAGVDLLYYAHPLAISRAADLADGLVVAGKSGNHTVKAKAFVDATDTGLLWTSEGASLTPPAQSAAIHVINLNGAADIDERLFVGAVADCANVAVKPNVWPGEVAVEFEVDTNDIRTARRAEAALLAGLRDAVPALAEAVVTSVAPETFPLHSPATTRRDPQHPVVKNLFGAGPWICDDPRSLDGRIRGAAQAAEEVAAQLHNLPVVAPAQDAHAPVAPPVHECDVVVCGGGTAGAFAAIAAARGGAKTVLIEPASFLGGIGTGGGIHSYYHGVAGGIQDEADQLQAELEPLFGPPGRWVAFHPFAKKVVLQKLCDDAGVELVFNTTVTGVETEDVPTRLPASGGAQTARRVTGVFAVGPTGSALYKAQVAIDSTGDGDVAAMAGADYTFGRAADGLPHAYSLAAGRLDANGKLLLTNFDAGYCDPTDLTDMTRARRHALGLYWSGGFDPESRITYVAPLLGLRNSRQIVGDYRLTLADEIRGRQFPDVIAYAYSHFDNHGYDYENESDEAMLWVWALGNWRRQFGCEIPYRCLLPAGVEGLLVACRAISITHDAHNQLRMQRDMQRIGEAAGAAAALAVAHGVTPRALDVAILQDALLKSGALGPRERKQLPEPGRDALHEASWVPAQPPAMPLDECVAKLDSGEAREATWQLVCAGPDGIPSLKQALNSDSPQTRLWASIALGMLRQPEAVPPLIACVNQRETEQTDAHKAAPIWQTALMLLGRVGDPAAVQTIQAVLNDRDVGFDVTIAAVRALGRIGDASAVPAIEAMLLRDDLEAVRVYQVSTKGIGTVTDNARWQVDLSAAEALAKLGKPRPDLIAKHKGDERAYVRNYAAKLERELGA